MSMILVVDDDVDLREALCDALEAAGHTTIGARDGHDALRTLRAEPAIQLVLLDLMMPVMTGWDFRAAQLADPTIARIPVVVMTAAADLSTSPIDAALILKKPLTLARVLEVVAAHA
jgi:CheY-like chemotaxis protein